MEAEFLPDDDEDRVRVRVRNEASSLQFPLHIPVSGQPSGTDRDHGVFGLMIGIRRCQGRINERIDAREPVLMLDDIGKKRLGLFPECREGDIDRPGQQRDGQETNQHMPQLNPPDPEHADENHNIDDGVAQIRLDNDERERHQRDKRHRHQVFGERKRIPAAPSQQLGQSENKRNLGYLRWLERERSNIVPADCAVQIGAEKEDADEQQDRYSHRNRPYFQQNPVIEQRGCEHDDKAGRKENNRLHRGIGKARISPVGRTINDKRAENRKHKQNSNDNPIDPF